MATKLSEEFLTHAEVADQAAQLLENQSGEIVLMTRGLLEKINDLLQRSKPVDQPLPETFGFADEGDQPRREAIESDKGSEFDLSLDEAMAVLPTAEEQRRTEIAFKAMVDNAVTSTHDEPKLSEYALPLGDNERRDRDWEYGTND